MLDVDMETDDSHSRYSTLREKIAEHLFTGELLRRLWQLGVYDAEILRSEFDAGGYDLVLSCRNVVRHIQFKTVISGGKASKVNVSLRLAEKPSGCVIWMVLTKNLEIVAYRWFGAAEVGKPLPDIHLLKMATHTKGDSTGKKNERPNLRSVGRQHFADVESLDHLLALLLGNVILGEAGAVKP